MYSDIVLPICISICSCYYDCIKCIYIYNIGLSRSSPGLPGDCVAPVPVRGPRDSGFRAAAGNE